MVETINIPHNDLFQVLTSHNGISSTLRYDDYLGVHHDDGVVYVAITLRPDENPRKSKPYRRIAELAEEYAGTEPRMFLPT